MCYKQKRKVVSLNLAHPVDWCCSVSVPVHKFSHRGRPSFFQSLGVGVIATATVW